MTIGFTMPIVTTIVAGESIAAAVNPGALARAEGRAAALIVDLPTRCGVSTLERLVPPLLERGVVLRKIAVVEVDKALALVGVEADALLRRGRDRRVADARVVPHVLGKGFLCRGDEHLVQPDVRAVLVRRVLRNHEARDVERDAFLRRDGFHFRAGLLPLHGASLPHDAD